METEKNGWFLGLLHLYTYTWVTHWVKIPLGLVI